MAFGRVCLDHADSTKRFAEAPRQLRIQLTAISKQRSKTSKGPCEDSTEDGKYRQSDSRHLPVDPQEHSEADECGNQSTSQLHEACSDEITNSFRIGHHPRDQLSDFGRIVVAHRKPQHMRMHSLSHFS